MSLYNRHSPHSRSSDLAKKSKIQNQKSKIPQRDGSPAPHYDSPGAQQQEQSPVSAAERTWTVDEERQVVERLRDGRQRIDAELSDATNKAEWLRLDEEFHFAIYAAAERPHTIAVARTLRRSLNAYYARYAGPKTRAGAWAKEHRSMIRALKKRDAAKAAKELERHLRNSQAALVRALGKGGVDDG